MRSSWEPERANGGLTITTIAGALSGILVVDSEGRPVWWLAGRTGEAIVQARVSADGHDVLYHSVIGDDERTAQIIRHPFSGGDPVATPAAFSHHDFLEGPEGGFAFLQHDPRPVDGIYVIGDAIAEVDADGVTTRTVWSIWDDHDPGADLEGTNGQPFYDWTHSNGLAWDADTQSYLVSSRNLDAVFSVSRVTGATAWQLGGAEGDFTLTDGDGFAQQHSPFPVPGGLLLYDNGYADGLEARSEVAEFSLDLDGRAYVPTWTYRDGTSFSVQRGTAERLPNGNTLVGTGSAGRISEVTPEGEVVWQAETGLGSAFSFAHHVERFGGAP